MQETQPTVRDGNQIEEVQDRVAEERQAQENLLGLLGPLGLLGVDDAKESAEDEAELAVGRPRRKHRRPDCYGDWEYVREEESE